MRYVLACLDNARFQQALGEAAQTNEGVRHACLGNTQVKQALSESAETHESVRYEGAREQNDETDAYAAPSAHVSDRSAGFENRVMYYLK